MSVSQNLRDLDKKWAARQAAERANYQLYLGELAQALDVPTPQPRGSGYEFELPIRVVNPDGSTTTKSADLYKVGCFLLEAKDEAGSESREILMRRAFGQARLYAAWIDGPPPPYLLALDIGKTLMVWDRWSGAYGDFHGGRTIHLPTLADRPEDIALLRDIWTNPAGRDPRGRSEAVTREIALRLGELATSLEERGHDSEVVSRFLIRCVFSMFAEDVELLPGETFRRTLENGLNDPSDLPEALGSLWQSMDQGLRFGFLKLLRFNGHFFQDQSVLPLTSEDLHVLIGAAGADWREVEPSIMGTLLVRALRPEERHKLGAEYTSKQHVERVVRPTVEQPIRERWTRIQAEVLQARHPRGKSRSARTKQDKRALEHLWGFHSWLRSLRFLDPACGSGNFLYVTMDIVKQVELEVFRALEEISGAAVLGVEEVGPWQFYGLEVKAWAREIAELTLWIGYHQWWRRTHGHVQPPEPVLRDTGTLEHRDAVLAWDQAEEDPSRARQDPSPRIKHPVTGELVPDPEAKLPYLLHHQARAALWPEAHFIVGNPPYMGSRRMRIHLGEGYVDALHEAYPDVPDGADYVMYWWHKAADVLCSGPTIRAGLITTNSITQSASRRVIETAAARKVGVIWAIPDHPWIDDKDAAAVRVAITVFERDPGPATLVRVDSDGEVTSEVKVPSLNSDLTAHADVASASRVQLNANKGLAYMGVKLVGQGFVLEEVQAQELLAMDPRHAEIIRPFRAGRDLTGEPTTRFVIDYGLRSETEAGEFPVLYDIVRDRVKPERDANKARYKQYWWQFGVPNAERREAAQRLNRVIATVETSKHRIFTFLSTEVVPDGTLITIASDDAFQLGILSSKIHLTWSLAAGGTLEDRPRYQKSLCFDPFPFPSASRELQTRIAALAEKLDGRRSDAIRHAQVTLTGIYNVIHKLRSGEGLTRSERRVHEMAACGILRDMHDELDRLVAAAYGWGWPLEREEILSRLVALHDERVEEEKRGTIRWLRPDYQIPRFSRAPAETEVVELEKSEADEEEHLHWPAAVVDQIAAIQSALEEGPSSAAEITSRYRGARVEHVVRHLETLELMGEAQLSPEGRYSIVRPEAKPPLLTGNTTAADRDGPSPPLSAPAISQ